MERGSNKGKKNMKKRIQKALAFTVLCLSMMSNTVVGAAERKSVVFRTNGLSAPAQAKQNDEWKGDRLYLGKSPVIYDTRDSDDILWDVLDPASTNIGNSEGVFILSSYSLDRSSFNANDKDGNAYAGSVLENKVNTIFDSQENTIRDAFIPTSDSDAKKFLDYQTGGTSGNSFGSGSIADTLLFPISAYELDKKEYGFYHIGASVDTAGDGTISRMSYRTAENSERKTMSGSVFWTRSPYLAQVIEAGGTAGGIVASKFVSSVFGVAPAGNLNKNYISYLIEAQQPKGGNYALVNKLSGDYGNFRVALKDKYDEKFDLTYNGLNEAGGVMINIKSNAVLKHPATQITAILTDSQTGVVAAYGKVANAGTTGDIVIPKPANIAHGEYRLYLFDESVTSGLREVNYTSNIYGESDDEKILIDYGALKILSQPESVEVTEGEEADFSITTKNAEGFKWQFSDEENVWKDFAEECGVDYQIESDLQTGISTCKILDTVLEQDGMVIRCLVTGNGGQDYSSDFAILTVNPDLSKKSSSSTTSSSTKSSGGGKGHHPKKHKSSSVAYEYHAPKNPNPAPSNPVPPAAQYVWTKEDWDNYNKALAILAYNEAVKKQGTGKKAGKKSSSSSSEFYYPTVSPNVVTVSNNIVRKEKPKKIQLRKPVENVEPVRLPVKEKESIWLIIWRLFLKFLPWLLLLLLLLIIILIIKSIIDKDKKEEQRRRERALERERGDTP